MSFAAFHGWIGQHPDFALLAVFLIATAESLAVVGLVIPGVAMMFAAGALAGTGALAFWPLCAAAVAGAVAGDGLSFWLGWHYRARVGGLRPFRRHPELIQRGTAFFHRHGGLSVLLGRFVGPIRAIIPLVAGMLAMPPRRFLAYNLASALLWGPAYLLPGLAFGASLDLASAVAGRLAALMLALLALLWLTGWISVRLYRYFQPRGHGLILAFFELSGAHPLLRRLILPVIDPARRDYPGLAAWAAMLAAVALLPGLPARLASPPPPPLPWGHPLADRTLAVLGRLGEPLAALAFVAVLSGALMLAGQRIGAAHLALGAGFALALGGLLAGLFDPPPLDPVLLHGSVVFGFTAVLAADRAGKGKRWLAYPVAVLLAVAMAFARVQTGAAMVPAAGLALLLALAWLLPLGVAYRRHSHEDAASALPAWLAPVLVAALAGGLWRTTPVPVRAAPAVLTEAAWLEQGWEALPSRTGQPLCLQWAAPLAAIAADLDRAGWRAPVPLTPRSALVWLKPRASLPELPVPAPELGPEADALRRLRPLPDGRWLLLRLWPAGAVLEPATTPLWLGAVSFLEAHGPGGLWRYPRETGDPSEARERLAAELRQRLPTLERRRPAGATVLLIPPFNQP